MKGQASMILEELQAGRSIDRLYCLEALGIWEAPARISELRSKGFDIRTEMKKVKTRFGKIVQVAQWSMPERESHG